MIKKFEELFTNNETEKDIKYSLKKTQTWFIDGETYRPSIVDYKKETVKFTKYDIHKKTKKN